ncbi:hypothetical protein BOTBODRAFT_176948 [Botryobasidium botryosum FD-172 SS1]|uniref:OPT oligopeptide transporter n=1 Tax=Botryobasidium botryosum (strain FD-172 SS1) TaxID=930990 RepID=A0A067M862_BOTB1|nr:hypothetical protein BOTBODRAFT_176948 [Botryobasidium botryosum FD-172 SS1]
MAGTLDDEERPPSDDLKDGLDVEAAIDLIDDDVLSLAAKATGAEFNDPNADPDALGDLDDSPYSEVRSAVSNTDDPDMPVNTIRAWAIGLMWAILLPGLVQFFWLRYPSVNITPIVAQLLSLPMGRLAARYLPDVKIFGCRLNPGPFTIKEHVLIAVLASPGGGDVTDIVAVQKSYYKQNWGFLYQWLITLSTLLMGFSIGGITRRFLVEPPSMIWPSTLVQCALFNTLHSQDYAGMGSRGGISRERFFVYVFLGSFVWSLSYFSWVTWIAPNNVKINQIFGYTSGLGMSFLTFDWSQIAYIGSPLVNPWWAEVNIGAGFIILSWFLTPILYYTNTWYSKHLPMSSRTSYDNQMNEYNVSRVINPDSTFNLKEYQNYSPLFISMTFAVSYGLSFATITATIVHTILCYRKQIWAQARRSIVDQPDIHAKLMLRYRQIPNWWYLLTFVGTFACGIIAIEVWPTQLPVWAFVLSLALSFFYTIPIGILTAITNQTIGLGVISELIIGYILPGRPIAMMLFRTWGSGTIVQTLAFASFLKFGHYMKIPPRTMFTAQMIGTIVAGTVQLAVQAWMFSNIPALCDTSQKDGFVCPNTEVFATTSIIWGVIGPAKQFSPGQIYHGLTYFFLIGALLPVIPWWLTKKYPKSWFKYINIPIMLSVSNNIPPATASNYVPWLIVGFIFQYLIRRRHFSWWAKYNYVLSSALDSGVAISAVVIFFCLQYPLHGNIGANTIQKWWGNTVYDNTADANFMPLVTLGDGERFGPSSW